MAVHSEQGSDQDRDALMRRAVRSGLRQWPRAHHNMIWRNAGTMRRSNQPVLPFFGQCMDGEPGRGPRRSSRIDQSGSSHCVVGRCRKCRIAGIAGVIGRRCHTGVVSTACRKSWSVCPAASQSVTSPPCFVSGKWITFTDWADRLAQPRLRSAVLSTESSLSAQITTSRPAMYCSHPTGRSDVPERDGRECRSW